MAPLATIASLALKVAKRQPLVEVSSAIAIADGGLEGGVVPSIKRGLTLLSRRHWEETLAELHIDDAGVPGALPWHTRRANVLLDVTALPGGSLAPLIGQTIRLGPSVVLHVLAETDPCHRMDELHPGLLRALTPHCRAGVYGRVLHGGPLTVGDTVELLESTAVLSPTS